jgi:hypothetical protein
LTAHDFDWARELAESVRNKTPEIEIFRPDLVRTNPARLRLDALYRCGVEC